MKIFSMGRLADFACRSRSSSLTPCIETRWKLSVIVVRRQTTSSSPKERTRYSAMALFLPEDHDIIALGCSACSDNLVSRLVY